VDELDCVELMDEFEREFKMRIPEQDQKNLCASTVTATISYISSRVRLQYKGSTPRN
jgi:acyl carrier protein